MPLAEASASDKTARVDEVVYADSSAPAPSRTPSPDSEPADRIYSPSDPGVQPPVPVRQWFYTSPPEGVSRSSLNEVEIVVSEKGDVTSARIVAGPRSYSDGMILSALKGGKFTPARRDGRAVVYRTRVWVRVPER